MKKLLIMLLGLILALPAFAVDFEYEYEGKILTYTIIDEQEKTCMTGAWSGSMYNVSGHMKIPATVIYNDTEFTVTTIGEYTFGYCELLASVDIPSSVTVIGNSAFMGCTNLMSVEIPASVTAIGAQAFYGCTNMSSVEISAPVTEISDYAFYSCRSLKSVEIPASVTKIGDSAFCDCVNLTSVEIPATVTAIGNEAFSNCVSLPLVEIPASVTEIGNEAFKDCDNLTAFNVAEDNGYFSSKDGVLFNKDQTLLIQYPVGNEREIYSIPNTVTEIGSYAFSYCFLTSIELPGSVTVIDEGAFSGCRGLFSIDIPASVTEIGDRAFIYTVNLTDINVAEDNGYFSSIDGILFNKDRTRLIQYPIGNERKDYSIPGSVTVIDMYAFYCSYLTSVEIPDGVTEIGEWAFANCEDLINGGIPDSVTKLGWAAFYGCTSMTSVKIPASVTAIGEMAFQNCSSLSAVYYNTEQPIAASAYTFGVNLAYMTLYVPEAAIELCKVTDPWMRFPNIVAYDFTGIDDVKSELDITMPMEVYGLDGMKAGDSLDGLAPGLYIVRQGHTTRKVAVK